MMNDGTFHFTLKNDYDEIWKIKINVKKRDPSRTRYLLDIYKTKSYLPETYLIDNYLVTYCHLLKISFLNI